MKQGWEIKKLGEIARIINGYAFDSKLFSTDENDMPLIRIRDIKKGYTETFYKGKYSDNYIVKNGDYIIGMDGEFNITEWGGGDALLNQRVCKIEIVDDSVIGRYVLRFLSIELKHIEDATSFVTVKHLSSKSLLSIPIPVPERAEQERIVGELDCLSGIIANKRAQLRELDTLAQSIFYTMFGDPITNDKGWQTKKLGDVALIVGGSTPSTREETNWNGDLNWVTPAELNGTLYYGETQRKITTEGARGLEVLPVGTVLLSSRAPIGKLAITTVPMYCNQGFKNVVCGESINNIYVYYYLLATIENVKALGVGATFKEVSKRAVENYYILVPPIDLQKQFAEKIENIERQKELITKSIKETEDLFNSRMSCYFD